MRTPVKLFRWWTGIVSASCIFALTFLSVALLAAIVPFNVIVPLAVAAATLAAVSSYAWIQHKARKNVRLQVALASRDLATGDVRSEIYNITDAVAVEESEDEGRRTDFPGSRSKSCALRPVSGCCGSYRSDHALRRALRASPFRTVNGGRARYLLMARLSTAASMR